MTDTKNTPQFTPGPWTLEHDRQEGYVQITSNGRPVIGYPAEEPEELANFQLIAAAPELYEALKQCHDAMEYMSEYDIPLTLPDTVKAALAKAEGKP